MRALSTQRENLSVSKPTKAVSASTMDRGVRLSPDSAGYKARSANAAVGEAMPQERPPTTASVIALIGIALSEIREMPRLDGIASLGIGVVLATTAAFLAYESQSLLTGVSRNSFQSGCRNLLVPARCSAVAATPKIPDRVTRTSPTTAFRYSDRSQAIWPWAWKFLAKDPVPRLTAAAPQSA
jgi:hypothetical protein